MKKLFKILFLAFIIFPVISFASHGEEIIPSLPASYLFHLYYDNGQLLADRDFEFKYDVVSGEFTPEKLNTQFPFKGEVINLLNQTVATFQFDPRGGNINFVRGKISVKAPYLPDGQKVVFYDSQNRQLLTIFVSDNSFCNDDAVCNFDRGEDEKTCPNDCIGATPLPLPGEEEEGGGPVSGVNVIILSILVVAFLAVGGWYAWRRWRKVKYVQENQFTNKLG